jgi:nitroreductase
MSLTNAHLHAVCRPAARAPSEPLCDTETVDLVSDLLKTRQNISPKRLVEPGPSAEQLQHIFEAAAAAPDHGLLSPWRFVVVSKSRRIQLGDVFALCLIDRDPSATLEQIEAAREKALRAPLLVLAVAKLGAIPGDIPEIERMVSVGAAIQNILLAAHGMGLGGGLTSGQALHTERMSRFFDLHQHEKAVCFINIGTPSKRKTPRLRPTVDTFVSTL